MTIYMDNFKRKYVHVKNVYVIKEIAENYEPAHLNHPEKISTYLHKAFEHLDDTREHFLSISVNAQNRMIAINVISIGSIDASIVHPREVFYAAIADKAVSIILCHNHPSGNMSPSQNDINLTRKLVEAGKIMGIEVLDHIILGDKWRYLSMNDQKLM